MKKFCLVLLSSIVFLTVFSALFYAKILPSIVSNGKFISFVEKSVKKYLAVDVSIEKPHLKTGFSPEVEFSVYKIKVKKDEEKLFAVDNLDLSLSLKKIFDKKIIINKFGADVFYADINQILSLFPNQDDSEENKSDWFIDIFDSVLYLNDSYINYTLDNGTNVKLNAANLKIDNTLKLERPVHFNFNADITRNNKTVNISFKDEDKIIIKNKHIYVNGCPLTINRSKMFFNAEAGKDSGFEVNIYAKRFFIPDVIKLLLTDIVENSIREPLEYLKNINGDVDFNVKITKDDFSGNIKINKVSAKLFPLANLPFEISSGDINIKGNDILLSNFKGFYDNKKNNEFSFEGTVKDYLKTLDTNIEMTTDLTNDLIGNYLSKTAGVSLTLTGESKAKIIIHSINNDIDVMMAGKIKKGDDILVEGQSLSPSRLDRALKADIHIKGDNVNIENINYYIAQELNRKSKGIEPILTLNGNIRISDAKVLDMGFDIPKPLPSEFLNVLIGQRLLKGGNFSGSMKYIDNGILPILNGKLKAEKIRIPSQRLFLKKGEISTKNNIVKIEAEGKYRKCPYSFNGEILNAIKLPIIVKHTDLTVDDVDIARLMQIFTSPVQDNAAVVEAANSSDDSDEDNDTMQTFDIGNLIVEDAVVNIKKGEYKEIKFSDVKANMSLDKNSIFKLESNKFKIADGHSSANVLCDLKNQTYSIKLGIKDVNSEIMSAALLNLPHEISGKASGLIDLNTDNSLKLNGNIKFIIKDGTIEKIGLVEYVLKFAALFRNPLVMISPAIFTDLVNIPEGNFDKITGDLKLKDNKIDLMKIKSYAPQLSAFIIGSYNLENSDAILRIYTKFSNKNKGVAGFLRNISLNSLANRVSLNSKNDSNYYEAELSQLPDIDADEKDCQIFLTKVDGDVEHYNFISSLKKIK